MSLHEVAVQRTDFGAFKSFCDTDCCIILPVPILDSITDEEIKYLLEQKKNINKNVYQKFDAKNYILN